MSRLLDVYLGSSKAGALRQDDDGNLDFSYAPDQTSAISVSMPVQETPYPDRVTRPFFSGLLPDEGARQRLAAALGISASNPFGLLEVIGGECAGALSLYPAGQGPTAMDDDAIETLSPARLLEILEKLRDRPLLGGEEGVRLSLAGAQDKLAICLDGDAIALAKGGRPTTHILKPVIPTLDGTVENEMFCMRLASRMKLNAPDVSMQKAGNTPFLLVKRYDRKLMKDGTIERLHQEDFCQAMSVPPELKYEEEGGPGTERSLSLIGGIAVRPAADRLTFIRMLIFHFLVGNADAHAKNYALLYRQRTPELAPLYDVICTAAYPRLAKKLAMAIGGRSIPDTIQLQHWLTLVPEARSAQRLLLNDLVNMASRVGREADDLIAELASEGVTHTVLKSIRAIIEARATHLLRITEQA